MNDFAELGRTLLRVPLNKYITTYSGFKPSPKQLAFMMLPHREALYGGRPRSGKSYALLADALRFCEVPYYSAIIFRLTLTDLMRAGGLLDDAHKWLDPWYPEVRFEARTNTFIFPQGGKLAFGYLNSYTAWMHYQGGTYQYIGWDELTQHREPYYGEMFSRLSRQQCPDHEGRKLDGKSEPLPFDPDCMNCQLYSQLSRVPLRVRGATNPGGPGAMWVKKKFKLHYDKQKGLWLSGEPNRPYIPATYMDNPHIDQEAYARSLDEITDPERRDQLVNGNWDRFEGGRFKGQWFKKRFQYKPGYYVLLDEHGTPTYSYPEGRILKFTVADIACSERTGVAEQSFYMRGGQELPASWTVIGTFGITPQGELLVLDIMRFQEEAPEVFDGIRNACRVWKPSMFGIEINGPGKPIAQLALQMGVPIQEIITSTDKIANSAEAQVRSRNGMIFLPVAESTLWDQDFLNEITSWRGLKDEPNDQVDVLSNAAHELTRMAGNMDQDLTLQHHTRETIIVGKHNKDWALTLHDGLSGLD